MEMTKRQAARFLLYHQGLLGPKKYKGKEGVLEYISHVRSVQYDPVDVCGRSAELVLLARVGGYKSNMLYELLYKDRQLIDYWDKCMCIQPVGDILYHRRIMRKYEARRGRWADADNAEKLVMDAAEKSLYISPNDISAAGKRETRWGPSTASGAAAQALYYQGCLAVHHKDGVKRYFSLPEKIGLENYFSRPDPNGTEEDYFAWAVRRRIHAVGMAADRSGDFWLSIADMKAGDRAKAFKRLINDGEIIRIEADGAEYYIDSDDLPALRESLNMRPTERCELIAPLDNIMWDRKLVSHIFDFDYKWEIYTPKEQRKYGHYVLPVLYKDRLAGRIEPSANKKSGVLTVSNFWPQEDFEATEGFRRALSISLRRLARLNGCGEVRMLCDI